MTGESPARSPAELGEGIFLMDAREGGQEGRTAVYLLRHRGGVAVIDPGPGTAAGRVLEAIEALGLSPEAVTHILLTHIHLDHAGAAGELAGDCPNARVAAHPRAVRHLVDPSRLVEQSRRIYGGSFDAHFGEIRPVPAGRIDALEDGVTISFGRGRELAAFHAPGHARHHVVFWEPAVRWLFTGDAAGVSFESLRRRLSWPGAVLSTPPPDFDPAGVRSSLGRFESLRPARLLLTHFGPFDEPVLLFRQLREQVDRIVEAAARLSPTATRIPEGQILEDASHPGEAAGEEDALIEACRRMWVETLAAVWEQLGAPGAALLRVRPEALSDDLWLNALGIAAYLSRAPGGA